MSSYEMTVRVDGKVTKRITCYGDEGVAQERERQRHLVSRGTVQDIQVRALKR